MTTSHAPDHQKISFTAKLVALARSGTTIPFARDVSEAVGAETLANEVRSSHGGDGRMPEVLAPLLEARYQSLAAAIKSSGVHQVVEFASGISLRGLAMTLADPKLTYVETDLPELTSEKQALVNELLERRHVTAPVHYHVATANILAWDEIEAALAPLSPEEPVAVVHEGLFQYLSKKEKEAAAKNVARILDRFGGLWVTPDFDSLASLSAAKDCGLDLFGRTRDFIEEKTGRNFSEYAFSSDDEVRDFCARLGFSVSERPQIDGSYELSSLAGSASSAVMRNFLGSLKLWEMRRLS